MQPESTPPHAEESEESRLVVASANKAGKIVATNSVRLPPSAQNV